jgi:integrase
VSNLDLLTLYFSGMAWIYERGANWWIGWRDQDGNLVQKSLKTTNKAAAKAELERIGLIKHAHAANAVTSDFVAAITGKKAEPKKTVAKYFDDWLRNAKAHLAKGTYQKYDQLAREFKAHVKADAAPILMDDITADNVREYLVAKRTATTHETTKGFRRILSGIFLQAQNEGQTTRNPVALAKLPKSLMKETGKRAFTLAEVKQLHDKASPFWQWMIRTAFFTGFSLGDLVTLRRVNVDLKQRTISIKRRKTSKPVSVPISDGVAESSKAIWPAKAEDYFWPAEAHKYLTTGASSFSQGFYDIMAACGLVVPREGPKIKKGKGRSAKRSAAGVGFHCLRHTFVTNLKMTGVMDSVAKELTGHGSSAISAVYTHLPAKTLADAISRIPEFSPQPPVKK